MVFAGHACTARDLLWLQPEHGGQLRLRYYGDRLLRELIRIDNHGLQTDRRIRLVRLVDDLLKPVMRDNVEAVDSTNSGTTPVGQAQSASDGLLDQDAGIGGAQRHDRVEVRHVPAFLEHVDVDNDLSRFLRMLDLEESLDHFLLFDASLAGVHLNDLVLIAAIEKTARLNELKQLSRMCSVTGDHEQKRLDDWITAFPRVGFQVHLDALVQADTVFKLQALDLLGRHAGRVKVLARDHGGLFHEAIGDRPSKRIVVNDVLEGHGSLARLDERCGRQLQS